MCRSCVVYSWLLAHCHVFIYNDHTVYSIVAIAITCGIINTKKIKRFLIQNWRGSHIMDYMKNRETSAGSQQQVFLWWKFILSHDGMMSCAIYRVYSYLLCIFHTESRQDNGEKGEKRVAATTAAGAKDALKNKKDPFHVSFGCCNGILCCFEEIWNRRGVLHVESHYFHYQLFIISSSSSSWILTLFTLGSLVCLHVQWHYRMEMVNKVMNLNN